MCNRVHIPDLEAKRTMTFMQFSSPGMFATFSTFLGISFLKNTEKIEKREKDPLENTKMQRRRGPEIADFSRF